MEQSWRRSKMLCGTSPKPTTLNAADSIRVTPKGSTTTIFSDIATAIETYWSHSLLLRGNNNSDFVRQDLYVYYLVVCLMINVAPKAQARFTIYNLVKKKFQVWKSSPQHQGLEQGFQKNNRRAKSTVKISGNNSELNPNALSGIRGQPDLFQWLLIRLKDGRNLFKIRLFWLCIYLN